MSNFKVGQKVVCINASGIDDRIPLIKNEIYTIRHIRDSICRGEKTIGVLLQEISNTKTLDDLERGYVVHRFRPLDHQFAEDVIAYITQAEQVTI